MRAGCASEESPLNHPGILRVSDNAGIAISQTYGVAVDAAGTPPLAPLAPARRTIPPWVCCKANVPPAAREVPGRDPEGEAQSRDAITSRDRTSILRLVAYWRGCKRE